MITISFYSYKGGLGRSLTLANLGVYLSQFGATVVMIDFDLEAPGLQYKIRPGTPIDVGTNGLAHLLAEVSRGTQVQQLDVDFAVDLTEHVEVPRSAGDDLGQPQGRLLLVPAGNPLDPNYWLDLASIEWPELFNNGNRRGVSALSRLRDHIIAKYNPDVLLIDSRTGITPSGGVATTLLPDVVVMLMLNNSEHLDGSRMVISAITGDRSSVDDPRPRVVPVLSRYTSQDFPVPSIELRHRIAASGRTFPELDAAEEDIPLDQVRDSLVRDLGSTPAEQVAAPLVLHADIALQRRERLSFGPYSSQLTEGNPVTGGATLLDDYLRLFASLVPPEMVARYLSGIRSKVRSIILDRPDEAVRTLENLTALVGDEAVFEDLVKVHVLRRDVDSMLQAAGRLHHVHGSIVLHDGISQALRDLLLGRLPRSNRVPPLRSGFLEDYWRKAAPEDAEWGAGVARALAERGNVQRAAELCAEILSHTENPTVLAQVVSVLVGGGAPAEQLAVDIALQHFDLGSSSVEFVRAAASACRFRPNVELAHRLVQAQAFGSVQPPAAIDVLITAGHYEEAATSLIEVLSSADPREVERYASSWAAVVARNKDLRTELQSRNPRAVEMLDSLRDEGLRSGREPLRAYR